MSAAPNLASLNQPLLLAQAIHAFVPALPAARRRHAEASLLGLDRYLGGAAPLLAYTRLTGEAWARTLPEAQPAEARALLGEFRTFLRDGGWLDAARPVNQFD
ncbi:hypothetical protein GCM10008955_12590 [Deinococcus malanensis]|uniref:Uncharacterized protein n=1 Tax=Deinococcus malanensis TaxID=1706855 RepID=A0ABQ2EQC7_9DEIO|nr:hypothetical protein [Deinococcus malanensis]GGK20706.1 hypothetical protein GCM10008955_12590 [Deinococcus malanensis]